MAPHQKQPLTLEELKYEDQKNGIKCGLKQQIIEYLDNKKLRDRLTKRSGSHATEHVNIVKRNQLDMFKLSLKNTDPNSIVRNKKGKIKKIE